MRKQWKEIPGYENYKVSTTGEVKSYKRFPEGKLLKPKILKQAGTDNERYLAVRLYDDFGNYKTYTIHSLVMKTFVGERPPNMTIDHIKSHKRMNNSLSNLRYVTQKVNVQKEQADDLKCIHESGESFFCKGLRDAAKRIGTYHMRVYRMINTGKSHNGWICKLIRRHEK